ncbi:MAG: biosynthetic-type acetolactate synthase large subunit [Treponema sp.]|nr:biosynthetic-type acetolactate synthase large subunit [Treponema sp.]
MDYTGARIIIECLIEHGVDTVFGYPGGAILNVYDELYMNAGRIRHILTAHEQGASHAADGYARSTGRVGVVLATSGPGSTNLVTGIATAYMDSVPIVAITCNVSTSLLGKDSFQEVDITGITMPITKHNFIVRDVAQLADTIRAAFLIARSGRPGPVLVDIPKDVTAARCQYVPVGTDGYSNGMINVPVSHRVTQAAAPHDDDVARAAAVISAAVRPIIYAGGGVIISDACAELRTFAEQADIPVCTSLMGKSAFPNDHPLALGLLGMHGSKAANTAVAESDVVIAVGTRFSDRVTGNPDQFAHNAAVIHIDIDPAEINKNITASYSLIGTIKETLIRMQPLVHKCVHSAWRERIAEWQKEVPPSWHTDEPLPPKLLYEYVHSVVPADTIITTEVGQHQMWAAQFYQCHVPRTFLSSGGLGTMGYGTGAAIGAQVAHPERTVVHFAGDGSFLMNCTELATIHHYGLPIIIIVMNNGALGNVRMWQTLFYEKRYSQTTLDFAPDFVQLAAAYGITGCRVHTIAEFRTAFDAAVAAREPRLIDAEIALDAMVLPMIPPGKTVQQLLMEIKA